VATTPLLGTTVTLQCAAGYNGNRQRQCSASSVWGTVVDTCVLAPTCTDGVLNQGEQYTDCGGTSPCPACSPCASIVCGAHGTCVETPAPAHCNCTGGWTGNQCEISPDPCTLINCGSFGNCIAGTCNCINGYTGTLCETPPAPTCTDAVKNGQETGIDCGGTCPACPSYSWFPLPYSTCSKSCDGGTQTRTVECRDQNGMAVTDSNCTGLHPLLTEQTCNTQPCGEYT